MADAVPVPESETKLKDELKASIRQRLERKSKDLSSSEEERKYAESRLQEMEAEQKPPEVPAPAPAPAPVALGAVPRPPGAPGVVPRPPVVLGAPALVPTPLPLAPSAPLSLDKSLQLFFGETEGRFWFYIAFWPNANSVCMKELLNGSNYVGGTHQLYDFAHYVGYFHNEYKDNMLSKSEYDNLYSDFKEFFNEYTELNTDTDTYKLKMNQRARISVFGTKLHDIDNDLYQAYIVGWNTYKNDRAAGPGTTDFKIIPELVVIACYRDEHKVEVIPLSGDHTKLLDTTTGAVYSQNKSGDIVDDKGKKVDLMDKCMGLGTNGTDRGKCIHFAKCLADGNAESLKDCLTELADKNMFSVASDGLKVQPEIALRIIEKFRIPTKQTSRGRQELVSFDTWFDKLPDGGVKEAIKSNVKLQEYLKGVIAFVNRNPVILNGTKPRQQAPSEKGFFRKPPMNMGNDLAQLIKDTQRPQYGMPSHFQMPPFTNATPMTSPGFGAMFGAMFGGGATETLLRRVEKKQLSSQILKTLVDNVVNDLQNKGINIDSQDLANLNDGIQYMGKLEDRIIRLYVALKKLSDVSTMFKSIRDGTIKFENLDRAMDTLLDVQKNINRVQVSIKKNTLAMDTIYNDELTKLQKLLELSS